MLVTKAKLESLIERYKDIIRRDNVIITKQSQEIIDLKRENKSLKDQLYKFRKNNLSSIYGCMHQDIDFPNSSKEPKSSGDKIY